MHLRTPSFLLMLLSPLLVASETLAFDWPTFRGADRTAVAPDTNLLSTWPTGGPTLLWETKGAGRGYASPAIADGKIFTLGDGLSTANDSDEYLTCFDLESGEQLWKMRTGSPWTNGQESWQSSRGTPTAIDGKVYVLTPTGDLICATYQGDLLWRKSLERDFNGKKADIWGYSESVLIDGEMLVCTPGGPANTMVALNKDTGELVWSCQRPSDRGAGHASIVISNVGGQKVYVQTTGSGGMGVHAENGGLLWTYDIDRTTAVIPTPIVKDDYVLIAAGYKRGAALVQQIPGSNGTVAAKEIYPLQTKLANKHGGIVLLGDYLYGDSDDKGRPYCANFMTGEVVKQIRGSGSGSASVCAGDGRVYVRYSSGHMTIVDPDPTNFTEVSSFKVPGSGNRPSWAHPVIDNGKLYLREGDAILCFDIAE